MKNKAPDRSPRISLATKAEEKKDQLPKISSARLLIATAALAIMAAAMAHSKTTEQAPEKAPISSPQSDQKPKDAMNSTSGLPKVMPKFEIQNGIKNFKMTGKPELLEEDFKEVAKIITATMVNSWEKGYEKISSPKATETALENFRIYLNSMPIIKAYLEAEIKKNPEYNPAYIFIHYLNIFLIEEGYYMDCHNDIITLCKITDKKSVQIGTDDNSESIPVLYVTELHPNGKKKSDGESSTIYQDYSVIRSEVIRDHVEELIETYKALGLEPPSSDTAAKEIEDGILRHEAMHLYNSRRIPGHKERVASNSSLKIKARDIVFKNGKFSTRVEGDIDPIQIDELLAWSIQAGTSDNDIPCVLLTAIATSNKDYELMRQIFQAKIVESLPPQIQDELAKKASRKEQINKRDLAMPAIKYLSSKEASRRIGKSVYEIAVKLLEDSE